MPWSYSLTHPVNNPSLRYTPHWVRTMAKGKMATRGPVSLEMGVSRKAEDHHSNQTTKTVHGLQPPDSAKAICPPCKGWGTGVEKRSK